MPLQKKMIPVNSNRLNQASKKLLSQCIRDGWISGEGEFVQKFEQEFADYIGSKYAVAVNSGTSALHVALATLGIGSGDEVILPASTIGACYFAIWYLGAVAVPVDVSIETYNIDPQHIESAITAKTKAIMVVHLFGRPCNMSAIKKIAKKYNLFIIEDAAEAHGATIGVQKVGSIGDIGCFSFYANKILTTGEGGMVVTNNQHLAEVARRIHLHNRIPENKFTHFGIGYSYAMSNLQAAVGLTELAVIEKNIQRKLRIANEYEKHLHNIYGLYLPKPYSKGRQVFWMYAIRIVEKEFGCDRTTFAKLLLEEFSIQTRTFFYDPKRAFQAMNLYQKTSFPVAEKIANEGLYLPSGTGTTFTQVRTVISAVKTLAKRFNASKQE